MNKIVSVVVVFALMNLYAEKCFSGERSAFGIGLVTGVVLGEIVRPQPVYVQSAPVYVQQTPVFVQSPYLVPTPVYIPPTPPPPPAQPVIIIEQIPPPNVIFYVDPYTGWRYWIDRNGRRVNCHENREFRENRERQENREHREFRDDRDRHENREHHR